MIHSKIFGLSLLVLCAATVVAQDFSWTITTIGGVESQHVAVQSVRNDSLFVLRKANFADVILIDSIATLERRRSSAILAAALIGVAAGGAIGYSVRPMSKNQDEANIYGGVFGAVLGGVAGYFVGSIIQSDTYLNVRPLSRESKIEKIRDALH